LAQVQALPLAVQTPNDLAHVFDAVDDATHEHFAELMIPVTVAVDRPQGWTATLVRALWRMRGRYALLVVVCQNLGCDGEAKEANPSSASFRQLIDVGKVGRLWR
jgi:hypothetical protein